MLSQLLSIFALGTLTIAAFGVGRPISRGLGVGCEDRLSRVTWSLALGLVAVGMLLLGLGLVGLLTIPVIGILTMAACFWGLGQILRDYLFTNTPETASRLNADSSSSHGEPCAPPPRWLSRGILLAAIASCVASLIGALAPPIAGDAMCYHLELPKTFLLDHRIAFLPYHENSTFPLLTEMWYLWGLAVEGGTCAQLIHWGMGLLLALATVVLATPILGTRWARVAGAVVLLIPGINNQMTAPMNDVALAMLTTLAVAAWWRAAVNDEGRRWFLVAGICGGGALGVKYLAIVFAAAVAATWLWMLWRQPDRRRPLLAGAAVTIVVAMSIGGPWYARAAWHRGNPVYPFFGEARETLPASKSPMGRDPVQLAIAPWRVTMQPEQFGGRGHQLGILPLVAVPGIFFCRKLRGLGILLATAAVYCVIWFLLRQNVRFLFPIGPLLCVAIVWVWVEVRRFPRPARQITAAAFALIIVAMAAVPWARSRGQMAVAVGWQPREAYLSVHEPTYQAAELTNLLASEKTHLLSQDYRAFHFNCRVTRENVYRKATGYDRRVVEPAMLSEHLHDAGFTHLLLAETVSDQGPPYDPTLSRLVDAQLAGDAADELQVLTDYRHTDPEGTVRRYRLVALSADRKQE